MRRITFNSGKDEWPSWSPDGSRIVHSSEIGGDRDIVVTEVASGASRTIYSSPADENQPAWSPDGRWIVLTVRDDARDPYGALWLITPDGAAIGQLTGDFASDPAWSPDSQWVVFTRGVDTNQNGVLDSRDESDLWAVQVGTGLLMPALQAPGSDFAPSWTASR
jgi:Tol biopolymer transport system component